MAGFIVSLGSAAGATDPLVRPHQLANDAVPKGSTDLGPSSDSQQLSFSVVLAPSNEAGLKSLLSNLDDPSSPQYHQWLKPGQFDAEFGPSPAQVAAVQSWLHSRGIASTSVSGSTVSVQAPVGTVNQALGTTIERYRLRSGQQGYVAKDTPLVPASLAQGQIASIVGLNTLSHYSPELITHTPSSGGSPRALSPATPVPAANGPSASADASAAASDLGATTLDQIGNDYGMPNLFSHAETGHGETVGVYELAPHTASDVSSYLSCFSLTNAVSTVTVDGGGTVDTSGTAEADLDIEQVATQAPQASIISYEGPNTAAGAYDVWHQIVTADAAQAISTSWGECEALASADGSSSGWTGLFAQAAAQGQTIFAATGDAGSEDCIYTGSSSLAVDYPGSDPNVVAVGGTTLNPNTHSEVVWNDCQTNESLSCAEANYAGAGGGGLSTMEQRPSYQPSIEPAESTCPLAGQCREVPDVSANAGTPMLFANSGYWEEATGTSFAAPLWAGITADHDEGCTSGSGQIAPALYALNQQGAASDASAFRDITAGDNDFIGANNHTYAATSGYDLATGIGSPVAAGLSCPEVTSVTPGQPGHNVTLSGIGLDHASFTFGTASATVVSATDTSAVVTVPAGTGTVAVTGTSSALGTGTTTSTFTYPAITTPSLASGVVGTAYSQALSAVGVSSPLTWSISAGALPLGLNLNASTGVISGTPTTAGAPESVTISLSANGATIALNATFTIQIYSFGSTTTPTVTPGDADLGAPVTYGATVTSSGGVPSGTVTFSIGTTSLCTTGALVTGSASCASSAAPAGTDTVTATYSGDATYMGSVGSTTLAVTAGPYTPITPTRICDTRSANPSGLSGMPVAQCNGVFNSGSTIVAGGTLNIVVAGSGSVVPANATSVVLNVTVVNPTADGFITAYPTGVPTPTASNVNYVAGEVIPNLVDVGIGNGGQVSFFAHTQSDLVVDIEGFTAPTAAAGAGAGLYTPLASPARVCDTRTSSPSNECTGERLAAASMIPVKVGGLDSVPTNASAVVLNVTDVAPTGAGFITVYPDAAARPTASNLNFTAGKITANRVIVPLSAAGKIDVYSSQSSDVVVDVSGYYSGPGGSGSEFNAEAAPVRVCDTRTASPVNQCSGKPVAGGSALAVTVAGLAGVPASGAKAVVINLTAVVAPAPTFLTVFPALPLPTASDLNPATGEIRANLVVATVSASGQILIYNLAGTINVVVDVMGWYS